MMNRKFQLFPRRAHQLFSGIVASTLLVGGLSGCVSVADGASATQAPLTPDDIQLVTVIQSSSNEYMLDWAKGSEAFAKSVGLPLKTIVSNGDSQQQLSQIQATIASGKKVVVNINPISSADVPAIVKAVTASGGYIVTQWQKPADYFPWNVGPGYVAAMTYDGVGPGYDTAKALFDAMGGTGGVVAFQGILDSPPAQQRYEGFHQALAEYPGITLLDTQTAGWDRQKAFDITQNMITKYGDQLAGVWSASDSMALGALSALDQAGRASTVKMSGVDGTAEAVKQINEGENYVISYTSDPYYNGAVGLAMAYEAAIGKLDVASLTHEQRDGVYSQSFVDKQNSAEYLQAPTPEEIMSEVDKGVFERLIGPNVAAQK